MRGGRRWFLLAGSGDRRRIEAPRGYVVRRYGSRQETAGRLCGKRFPVFRSPPARREPAVTPQKNKGRRRVRIAAPAPTANKWRQAVLGSVGRDGYLELVRRFSWHGCGHRAFAGTLRNCAACAAARDPPARLPGPVAAHRKSTPASARASTPSSRRFPSTATANPRVFFLGFAGLRRGTRIRRGDQARRGQRRRAFRLDAERSLLLVNDRRDRESYPIATHATLAYALGALARVMDPGATCCSSRCRRTAAERDDRGVGRRPGADRPEPEAAEAAAGRGRNPLARDRGVGLLLGRVHPPLADNKTILITAARQATARRSAVRTSAISRISAKRSTGTRCPGHASLSAPRSPRRGARSRRAKGGARPGLRSRRAISAR